MRAIQAELSGIRVELELAESSWERMKGLIGRGALTPGRALWIQRCNSVHMLGVCFALDLVWLDRKGRVVGVDRGVRPGLRFRGRFCASSVLEMSAGGAEGIRIGDRLELV